MTAEPALNLTPDQIEFFHREGYLTLERLTCDEELEQLRAIYDRLFSRQAGREEGAHLDLAGLDEDGAKAALPQILNPKRFAPELERTRFRHNVLNVAKQLFGPEADYRGEHMIYKPARVGAETPWHQDQAYHNPDFIYRQVNFWMPLDPARVENGCMQFVPKSHTWDVLPHHHINHDPRIHGLEVDEPERCFKQAVACPLPPGGASLHHSYLLHYAGPNRSETPRRAYILTFAVPPAPRREKRVFSWQQNENTSRQRRRKEHEAKTVMS